LFWHGFARSHKFIARPFSNGSIVLVAYGVRIEEDKLIIIDGLATGAWDSGVVFFDLCSLDPKKLMGCCCLCCWCVGVGPLEPTPAAEVVDPKAAGGGFRSNLSGNGVVVISLEA
jgi:hypothetical protein